MSANNEVAPEMYDYIVSLREGIMDAWGGIVIAFKGTEKVQVLEPHVQTIWEFLTIVARDDPEKRSEGLLRSMMGVMGDLAECFPNGEIANYYRQDFVTPMVKEVRANRDFTSRTIETARWTREQIKRQLATVSGGVAMS